MWRVWRREGSNYVVYTHGFVKTKFGNFVESNVYKGKNLRMTLHHQVSTESDMGIVTWKVQKQN